MAVILVGGGSRSGKSRYAIDLARQRGHRLGFIATAEALDDEMRRRAEAHRAERGAEFTTIEEPFEVAPVLTIHDFDAIVVDCLTVWLSNIMLTGGRNIEEEIRRLLDAAVASPADVILVANEVGCGIVPENDLSRWFRDLAGTLNQRAAERALEVYWMIFGYPLKVK